MYINHYEQHKGILASNVTELCGGEGLGMVLFVKREQPARHLPRVDSLDKSEVENTQLYPQNGSDHGLSDPLTVHLALGLRWGNTSAHASPFVAIMYQYCWDLKRRRRDAIRKHCNSIVSFIFPLL
jgi:hypothetical protein